MAGPAQKNCSKCGENKSLDSFYKNRTKKYGVCSECKECSNKANRSYVKRNKQKYLNYQKKYHQEHRLEHRSQNLKQNYGISLKEWEVLFKKQQGRCAICKTHQAELKRRLDVDHNHLTGKVRNLLCSRCNRVIGGANEDIGLLKNIIKYLEKHNG